VAHHGTTAPADPVDAALALAAGILPDQGPIGVFIHHNTLHALQHLPFHQAVAEGARLTGAMPYLPVQAYREAWRAGRIAPGDLEAALRRRLGDAAGLPGALGMDQLSFWRLLLLYDPDPVDVAGTRFRLRTDPSAVDEAIHHAACVDAANRAPAQAPGPPPLVARHHDAFVALGSAGTDPHVHRELIRLASGFLDQGQALATMPGREAGFLHAVAALYAASATQPRLAPGIAGDLADVARRRATAREVVIQSLEALGVRGDDRYAYILRALLALPGWAGMFSRLERHPEEADPDAPARLEDFLAVRLIIERRAVERAAADLDLPAELASLRRLVPAPRGEGPDALATRLHAITFGGNIDRARVAALTAPELGEFSAACDAIDGWTRRAVWHDAYEGWYRRQILDALAARRAVGPRARPERPEAQFVFCIDEREESIRRAVEEQGPGFETFGAAGFFGIAIDFRGLYDTEPAAHCPVVVVPDHEVHEAPLYTAAGWHDARLRMREAWHVVHRGVYRRSRTLLGGVALSLLLGPVAAVVALMRVAFPRSSLGWATRLRDRVLPRPATRLASVRTVSDDKSERGKWLGFTLDEAADRVAGTLRAIGLVQRFAPTVVVLGHGSTSLNNPHESAHDCGACGGRRGGANARLFAEMANRPAIRDAVRQRGIDIPPDTWFVGGLHDTADDGVHYYDVDVMPREHYTAFAIADAVLEAARQLSAQERCRRFHHAPLGITPAEALLHVEDRAAHLGQPRPEYGHCTNAAAVVGRRECTRGLHLDRRAFLISYDPSIDPEAAILERVLAAVGPVGAGISLEYYFSSVDNEVYGCGTKLPHNVTGFVGVMNGHHSDLRTGLPLQMVELHEPVRLLLVVEATTDALLRVAGRQPEVHQLVVNEWVQLVSLHPDTGEMQVFQDGAFHPYQPGTATIPRVRHSIDWHGQSREHLTPALVTAALVPEIEPTLHALAHA
jgi:hypothetical protein